MQKRATIAKKGGPFLHDHRESRPEGVGESGDYRHDADEYEGRQEARTQRQHDGNTGPLCGGLRVGAKCAPSIVGEMHEDVGQCGP